MSAPQYRPNPYPAQIRPGHPNNKQLGPTVSATHAHGHQQNLMPMNMVAMPMDNQYQYSNSQDTSKSRDVRKVVLKRSPGGFGFNIIGGNQPSEGIFVSFILAGGPADVSGNLFKGDHLLSVNGIDLTRGTHEEAADALRKVGDRVEIVAQYRPEELRQCEARKQELEDLMQSVGVNPNVGGPGQGYGTLRTTQKKTLYVRALFTYDPSKDGALPNKGLPFQHGDILHVTNASDDEWWQAKRVGINGEDEPGLGIVPSKKRVERRERARLKRVNFSGKDTTIANNSVPPPTGTQPNASSIAGGGVGGNSHAISSSSVLVEHGPPGSGTLERKKKPGFLKKLTGRGKDTASDENNDEKSSTADNSSINTKNEESIRSYETVVQEELRIARPVVIFGPLKERINDELLREFPSKFASCVPHTTRPRRDAEVNGVDYHFVSSREEMDRDLQAHLFIEAGQYNGHLYGTSVAAVREVAEKGKHCVLDVSGLALRRLQVVGLVPIAIFIHLDSAEVLQNLSRRMTADQAKKAFERHCKLEQEFATSFTAMVSGSTFEDIYREVQKVIHANSGRTIWVASKTDVA